MASRIRRIVRRSVLLAGVGALTVLASSAAINAWIVSSQDDRIYDEAEEVPPRTAAIVLGASVRPDGDPSTSLADRLHAALALYRAGSIERILVSGDHGKRHYDEVGTMAAWLAERGVPRRHIFQDHAGFRTFDTMHRAARVFEVRDAVICTQAFHLPRSVFLAREAGIDAVGLRADRRIYAARRYNQGREFLARVRAFLDVHILPVEPRFLGEPIPIEGDGRVTWE
jgi:SanA protein